MARARVLMDSYHRATGRRAKAGNAERGMDRVTAGRAPADRDTGRRAKADRAGSR